MSSYSDPRDWDAAKRSAHLAELGLPLIPGGDGDEVSIYDRVLIRWTTTLDTRITLVIDRMYPEAKARLTSAYAHKGGCGFEWLNEVPAGYDEGDMVEVIERGQTIDYWVIEESTVFLQPPSVFDGAQTANGNGHQPDYAAYLRSKTWKQTRTRALNYYGHNCCLCSSTKNLNVHHRTYARVGHEELGDLTVLCRDCHSLYHGIK